MSRFRAGGTDLCRSRGAAQDDPRTAQRQSRRAGRSSRRIAALPAVDDRGAPAHQIRRVDRGHRAARRLQQLAKAIAKFEAADAKDPTSAESLVDWGNIVRAAGRYDDAATLYRRAANLSTSSDADVNIVVAYLDQVVAGPKPAVEGQLLTALGALSDYLAWTSAGSPFDQLIPKTKRALAQTGDADDAPSFEACLNKALSGRKFQRSGDRPVAGGRVLQTLHRWGDRPRQCAVHACRREALTATIRRPAPHRPPPTRRSSCTTAARAGPALAVRLGRRQRFGILAGEGFLRMPVRVGPGLNRFTRTVVCAIRRHRCRPACRAPPCWRHRRPSRARRCARCRRSRRSRGRRRTRAAAGRASGSGASWR